MIIYENKIQFIVKFIHYTYIYILEIKSTKLYDN